MNIATQWRNHFLDHMFFTVVICVMTPFSLFLKLIQATKYSLAWKNGTDSWHQTESLAASLSFCCSWIHSIINSFLSTFFLIIHILFFFLVQKTTYFPDFCSLLVYFIWVSILFVWFLPIFLFFVILFCFCFVHLSDYHHRTIKCTDCRQLCNLFSTPQKKFFTPYLLPSIPFLLKESTPLLH